jgi:hypothetical protein
VRLYSVLHIRSIERIYGNKGPDVVDKLFNNPGSTLSDLKLFLVYSSRRHVLTCAFPVLSVVAVPVILKRLKQKDNEWRNARREWNKIWREVPLAFFGRISNSSLYLCYVTRRVAGGVVPRSYLCWVNV